MAHFDFPTEARDMWDILAKALMIKAGGSVTLTLAERRVAAETQAEIELQDDGAIRFRIVRH